MQEKLQKLILPIAVLAVVGIAGAVYTIVHSGPTSANAQTKTVQNATGGNQDKETNDDKVNSGSVEKADPQEKNDQPDKPGQKDDGADGEVQDGK